jgi:hypothetical protein
MGVLVLVALGSGEGTAVLAGKAVAGAQAASMAIHIKVTRIFFI